jgi:dihydrofolate reductase
MMGEEAAKGMAATRAQLFGRKSYQIMARFWPNAPADDPFAAHLNPITKYVASRTLRDEDLTWQNSHLIKGTWPPRSESSRSRPS